ncbi:coagulation factor VII-like isoform X2 [Eublepharis macularius]|uniref:Coagulation factor VII-like isoform X2 n=1 Tax=Eublepharis macularius TaxID=481883 RepID=A0AA97JLP5_EUBMA|nr:coagulation factor VII-like isoform X2 [Eublepharis macularius]
MEWASICSGHCGDLLQNHLIGRMARSLLSMTFLLLICSLCGSLAFSFSVFLRPEEASQVLRIHKRANHFLEEIRLGDLERECMEEKCSFEEAKEIFKSQEKTMEFWFDYKDLNPCKENPCKNGGVCKVKYYQHSCICPPRFVGNECEIEKTECWYKNGDCWQYCQDNEQSLHVTCSCALGYTLSEDAKRCIPTDHFPCGLVKRSTHSNKERSFGHNQNDDGILDGENQTLSQENLTSWNQTLIQTLVEWNQTAVGGENEEYDFIKTKRNATESDLQSWINTNYTDENGDLKIIGGSFCRPGDCPWQVLIQNKKGYGYCGGSLISSQWVLTAAHCLDTIVPHHVTVGDFDKHQRDRDEQKVRVHQFWQHPQYDPNTFNNDIALIQLTSNVVFSQHVLSICLPSPNLATLLTEKGTVGTVSGWGSTHVKGRSTRFLLKVKLPVVSMDSCRQSTEKLITDNMFCAGYPEATQDSCKGDSGGPFAVVFRDTWFLLGIVSWGEGCAAAGKYGAYTRVSNYLAWIKEITESVTDSAGFLHGLK